MKTKQTLHDLRLPFLKFFVSVALGLSFFLAFLPSAVMADQQYKLPPGYYIFMGRQPGNSSPRSVVLNDDGSIHWQDASKSDKNNEKAAEQTTHPSITTVPPAEGKQAQWETYNYPMIKWKAHPVTTIPGGIAQLTTRFEPTGGSFGEGAIKYILTLFKVADIPYTLQVQLVDGNGFKVLEFQVYQSNFHPVPGTALLEASEECTCTEKEYKQARDYTVK